MRPVLVLAEGNFVDPELVGEHARASGVELRRGAFDTPAAIAEASAGAHAVLVVTNPLTRELIDALAPSVSVIGRAGVGLDAIDLDAAEARGLTVFHTPDYCVPEVVAHTLALLLALERKIVRADTIGHADWAAWRDLKPIRPIADQVVGVVGLGRIGRAVCEAVRPLVGSVIGHDPFPSGEIDGVERVDELDTLLERSDIVSLHLPLAPETRNLIDASRLARMRSGARLINVARGGLIDELALADAVSSGRIGGAALDVLANEPPAPDHPLLALESVIITPHLAWYSTASERTVWIDTIDGVVELLAKREPRRGRVAVGGNGEPARV
jgi:D-3-phosphoglycerate dehydrogenase